MTDKDILISDLNDISEILNNNGYGGWCASIRKAVAMLKEQEELLHKLQKDKDKLCLDVSEWKHKYHDSALKEQEAVEPKQVIRKQCKKEHEDGSIDYFAEWYCPHCNMLILRGFDNPSIKFCYKCGKPILWEGR